MSSPIAAAGLVLDIAGALFLAWAFMTKNLKQIREEAGGMYAGINPYLLLSMIKQRVDAQVGVVLLIAGFVAQLDGAMGWKPHWASLCLTIPIGVAVALCGLALDIFCGRTAVRNEVALWLEKEKGPEWESRAASVLRWPRISRHEGEALDHWGTRVLGRRRWERVVSTVNEE